jgi:hypothetical protein
MARPTDPIWSAVHPVVGHLLRDHALVPADVGLPRFDVLPVLSVRASCEVAVWICRQARSFEPSVGSTEGVEAWIAADRRRDLSDDADTRQEHTRCTSAVFRLAGGTRSRTLADLPRRAAQVATGGAYVQGSLVAMAKLLGEHLDVRVLAPGLDDAVLRAEAQAGFDRYAPSTAVQSVVWRGARGSGPAGHFLVRTADGFALLTKLGRRWGVVAGDEETVLASLPDPLFAEGLAAVQASRARSRS